MAKLKRSNKVTKAGKRLKYRDLKNKTKLKTTKLNSDQIDKLSKSIAYYLISPLEIVSKIPVEDSFIDENIYEPVNKNIFLRLNISELHKRIKILTEHSHTFVEPSIFQNIDDHSKFIDKTYELRKSQVKNIIKKWISWSKQKPRKAVSPLLTLIKFIITPRLYGIYVSEEENNRVAVFSFSNC